MERGTDVRNRARYLVDDNVESPDALAVINSGLDDLSTEAPYSRVANVILPANTRSIPLPPDCMSVVEVLLKGKPMEEMDIGEYENLRGHEVTHYCIVENTLEFRPLPYVNQNLRIVYLADYGQLVRIEDPIQKLPRQFRMALVYWLAMHFRYNNEDRDWSIVMNNEYLRYRAALRTYQDNRGGYSTPRSV